MKVNNPGRLKSYFSLQKKNLCLIAITGIIYNAGMTAGPFFEGRLAQCLYDIMGQKKDWQDMLSLATVYILAIFFVQGSRAVKRYYVRRFANDTSKNMRHMLYNSIVHTEKRKLEEEQLGTVMTKAVSDVDTCVEGMRKFTTEIFDTGIVLIAYLVMLCCYDFRLTIISCIFIPVAYIIAEKCKGIVTGYNEIYKKSAGKLNQSTMDLVGNVITYRVFGLEENRRNLYEKDLHTYEKSAVRANLWESALQPIYYVISMCGAVLIFYFGGRNVLGTGWTTWDIGVFTTFFSCFTKLALKSSKAAKLFNAVQKASVSWKRIQPMFQDYIEDKVEKAADIQNIRFEHVDVFYTGHSILLHDISFAAKKGQMIGITGEVASGKTSIGKLLIGEADYRGRIMLDDRELSNLSKGFRKQIFTYMGHEPELMSTSIEENICLGVQMKQSSVTDVLKKVCMEQEIASMPDGIKTRVGNGGMRLSGGQQARIALARCIQYGKEIMILDDPFSAVDMGTERIILEQLRTENKDKITLLISHRLSVFPSLDGVLFLHDGTASFGTHEDLLKTEPDYVRLFQTGEEAKDKRNVRDTELPQLEDGGVNHA